MDLNELQSIRDRERQSSNLQQLRETFYADVGEFIQQLREEREAAAARADDPFDAPEVNRLTDDIKTAEQTVEAIYERRVGKLVKMASFAAADMPAEDEGLTTEERELFDHIVGAIEKNRAHVLDVLAGDDDSPPGGSTPGNSAQGPADATAAADAPEVTGAAERTETAEKTETVPDEVPPEVDDDAPTEPPAESVGAADLMGGVTDDEQGRESSASESTDVQSAGSETETADATTSGPPREEHPPDEPDPVPAGETGDTGDRRAVDPTGSDPGRTDGGPSGVPRRTVRITRDVGGILGVDEREYDLAEDDVIRLPEANVRPLVEREAAERLD